MTDTTRKQLVQEAAGAYLEIHLLPTAPGLIEAVCVRLDDSRSYVLLDEQTGELVRRTDFPAPVKPLVSERQPLTSSPKRREYPLGYCVVESD